MSNDSESGGFRLGDGKVSLSKREGEREGEAKRLMSVDVRETIKLGG